MDAANLTLVSGPRGPLIEHMEDSSGKGNHFFNYWKKRAGHRIGLDILQGDGYEYSTHQVYHMLKTGALPGWKLPGSRLWYARPSAIRKWFREAEQRYQVAAG